MTSESLKDEIWQKMYDANRLVRYHSALADKYSRLYIRVRVGFYACVIGIVFCDNVGSMLAWLPAWADIVLLIPMAIFILVDNIFSYDKKSSVLYMVSIQCSSIRDQWEELWIDAKKEEVTDREVESKIRFLTQALNNATDAVGHAKIQEDEKLNIKCSNDATSFLRSRYAIQQ